MSQLMALVAPRIHLFRVPGHDSRPLLVARSPPNEPKFRELLVAARRRFSFGGARVGRRSRPVRVAFRRRITIERQEGQRKSKAMLF